MASRAWRTTRLTTALVGRAASYLSSLPVIKAKWSAFATQCWTVPVAGGVGKIYTIGAQPLNAGLQVFDYVDRPSAAPSPAVRSQLQLLFPC
jgi:hypothetical protein